jgi:hypothetical protein
MNCYKCGKKATKLCDGRIGDGKTCDRAMCASCADATPYIACVRGGKGRNTSRIGSLDYCDECRCDGGR